jgi:hypothetical protein
MPAKKRKRKSNSHHGTNLAKKQKQLEMKLLKAMDGANKRGFTGNFGSKGSLFDDSKVIKAKAAYDKFLSSI